LLITSHINRTEKLFGLSIISLGLISCEENVKLEGVWYASYYINGEKKEKVFEKMLWDFSDTQLFNVQFGDMSTGNHDTTLIDSTRFNLVGDTLKLDGGDFHLKYYEDSIIVSPIGINKTLVLKRLSERYRDVDLQSMHLNGAFILSGESYKDSLTFINDSIFLHTGKYNMNFPAYKWQIIKYRGFSFFNVHDALFPIGLIKSWSENEVVISYPPNKKSFRLKHINSINNSGLLYGSWNEISASGPTKPYPMERTKEEALYRLVFEPDSLRIHKYGRYQKLQWNLTSDSKRIYFIDRIFKEEGSWKIEYLSSDTLVIRRSIYSGAAEEIIRLKKEKR